MTTARAHDQFVGRSLGEFVLREKIGEGGFGAVYRATQPTLDREAVVKVLHARLKASPAAEERFLREARLASKLDHPYAAHIYAFGAEPDGSLWIAMELVRGTPLDQVLRVQGPMALERFVQLFDRICEVVHTAHEQGIVHRDLKPANVMVLARAGRVLPKLLDFGIAKGLSDRGIATSETLQSEPGSSLGVADDVAFAHTLSTPESGLTQRGAIIGSPPYMAPEQWMDAGQVDARTDLYALGIVAYECLTGRPPFVAQTITAMATAHAVEDVPPLGAKFPAPLDAVFAVALAKDPRERYADALAFAAAFHKASGVEAVADTAAPSLPTLPAEVRDAALRAAPQPIAEAMAAVDGARNAHQARDALVVAARTIARTLGLVAIACRARVSAADAPELLRTLSRRALTDREWVELTRQLTARWRDARDAYPLPELVGAFEDGGIADDLDALANLHASSAGGDRELGAVLEASIARLARVLGAIAFLHDYPLVVIGAGGVAERWTGVRRAQRATAPVRGTPLPAGVVALLDGDGAPVVSLAPVVQVAAPTPGAPLDLFLFEGRDRRGAKLVALPSGFEHHDDEVWDWFRMQLAGSLDEGEAAVGDERAPYRGLSAFSAQDGEMFFGREKQVDAFVNRLVVQPLLAVVGRSGAGKSSFVQAGVIPALVPRWRAFTMRPGPSPLGALIARLEHAGFSPPAGFRDELAHDRDALGRLLRADAGDRGPVLLVVDQLEEMLTLCDDVEERRVFAETLAAAARSTDDPVRVVFTLRDDFLVRTEQVPALRNRIGQGLQILTVPSGDDLVRIVTEPARRLGYELEGDLATEMVREVADQPGALALISFTASKLWELRDRQFKRLTRTAYRSLGGVGGALARHAELTLDAMLPEERALTRTAFRHLVTTQNTRAIVTRTDLRQLLGGGAHADAVIEKLIAARLLVASENDKGQETVEIVHEALLAAWPRLVEWRREDSEGARLREQLRTAASQWDERGRERGLLWRGDALADYARWRAKHPGPLTDLEGAFADASTADAKRGRRNLRLAVGIGFVALTAGIVALSFQASQLKSKSDEHHDHLQRTYEDQGRDLVIRDEPLLALAYLAKATEYGATGATHDFLVAQAIRATDGELFAIHHDGVVTAGRFSNDGTRLLTTSEDHTAKLWDARTGALIATLPHVAEVYQPSFSPDDRLALTSSMGGATLWDAARGTKLHELAHPGLVVCAAFSPDGASVMTGSTDDKTLRLWRTSDGRELARISTPFDSAQACSFSADGALVAAADFEGGAAVWRRDGTLVRELRGHASRITSIAFAPDGARVATSSWDGTARTWALAGSDDGLVLQHRQEVTKVRFSPDGRQLVTSSADGTAVVWNAATGAAIAPLVGHGAAVVNAQFSPDGRRVVTASKDGSAALWDARTGRRLARWRGHETLLRDVVFDRSGTRILTASEDHTAIVWRAEPQDKVTPLVGHTKPVNEARFSPDGATVVTASEDGTARTWDARTAAPRLTLRGHNAEVKSATFSPDGAAIATWGNDGSLRIWNAATGAAGQVLQTGSHASGQVTWSPDGASLAVAGDDGSLRVWNAATGALRFENRAHESGVNSASFAPSGAQLLTTGRDGTTRVWSLAGDEIASYRDSDTTLAATYSPSGDRVLRVFQKKKATIWDPATGRTLLQLSDEVQSTDGAWSPDGAYVVMTGTDGTARVLDASTGEQLAIFHHDGQVFFSRFSPDGSRLVLAGTDTVAIYDLPHLELSPDALSRVLACRGMYVVDADRAVRRDREWGACQ